MQCKNHPGRTADHFCASCNAAFCSECVEEVRPGEFICFKCAMLQSVSEGGESLADKHRKAVDRKKKGKKKWGPFQYFLVVSSVLILVMWGVIIFGGQPAPQRKAQFEKKGRVLLFMVDAALKRYAHYEGNRYPERLSDLAPNYLSLGESELFHLDKLAYEKDPKAGYRLSLANPKSGELNLILSPKGIEPIKAPREDA